jgi:hypothetical protein
VGAAGERKAILAGWRARMGQVKKNVEKGERKKGNRERPKATLRKNAFAGVFLRLRVWAAN